ncbi:MAG: 4'-phosphopantetheinyl transferase [Thiohalomonadales bacterium]
MINTLIPDNIACEIVYENISPSEVYSAERLIIMKASLNRKQEFLRGRNCAHQAIKKLNYANQKPILIGKNREPVWPPGLIGSITHCNGYCAAVVAKLNDITGVGIDAELNTNLKKTIISKTQTDSEIIRNSELLSENNICINKLVFSAKESVFKFIHPFIMKYINFKDIEICVDLKTRTFSTSFLKSDLYSRFKNSNLIGKFDFNNKHIVTCIFEIAQ